MSWIVQEPPNVRIGRICSPVTGKIPFQVSAQMLRHRVVLEVEPNIEDSNAHRLRIGN